MSHDGRLALNSPSLWFHINSNIANLSVYKNIAPQLLETYRSKKHGTEFSVKAVNDTTKESHYLYLNIPPEIDEDDHISFGMKDSSKDVLLKLINSKDTWKIHFILSESKNRNNIIKESVAIADINFTPYAS